MMEHMIRNDGLVAPVYLFLYGIVEIPSRVLVRMKVGFEIYFCRFTSNA